MAIAAGMIIAQRRPMMSAVHPHHAMPRKLMMLAIMNGTAVPIVVSLRSCCKCVANSDQMGSETPCSLAGGEEAIGEKQRRIAVLLERFDGIGVVAHLGKEKEFARHRVAPSHCRPFTHSTRSMARPATG